jgi:hypothetical protein
MSLFKNAKLILTPNGYKTGELYALKPFDDSGNFDWTRNTKATRVNANGLIEEVNNHIPRLDYTDNSCPCILVEEQRTNLFLHSENFADSYWSKIRVTINSNVFLSPDGSISADKVVESVETGTHAVSRSLLIEEGQSNVSSFFVRKGERDKIRFYFSTASFGTTRVTINLSTKLIIDTIGAPIVSIEMLADDWIRVAVSKVAISTFSSFVFLFYILDDDYNESYLGDGVSGVYLWGAQHDKSLTSSSYIPTTSTTVTRNADIATVTPPVGTTEIIETFEDNSTNIITTIPSTYQLPVGRIKHVVMI